MSATVVDEVRTMGSLLEAAEALHARVVMATGPLLSAAAADVEDSALVDAGFLAREVARVLDDARKQAEKVRLAAGKELYRRHVAAAAASDEEPRVRGTLATATLDCEVKPFVPAPGQEAYGRLLRFLGVGDEAIRTGILGFRFRALSEMLTRMTAAGRLLPVETFSDYSCVFRRLPPARKVIDDDGFLTTEDDE